MEEQKFEDVHLDQASQLKMQDRRYTILILGFMAMVVCLVGIGIILRDVSRKAGYRSACTDIAHSNRMSDDCEIALFRGSCRIVCASDEIIKSGDFEQLDPHQGEEAEWKKVQHQPNGTWFWCWLHGGCINAAIKETLKPVEDQQATRVDCDNETLKDGTIVVDCPGTDTSEAHQVIVPAR